MSSRRFLMAGTALTAAILALGLTPGISTAQVVVSSDEIVDGTDPAGTGPGTRPSPWVVGDNLWIDDEALLTIREGGIVFSNEGRIAEEIDTTASVLVTGAGSRWENSGRLIVGSLGSASLLISDGATVANTDAFIGASAGSSTVTVSGTGSRWDNTGRLAIGNSGDGVLTISNGAVVFVDPAGLDVQMANIIGSTGVLNIGAASTDPDDAVDAGVLDAARIVAGQGTATINFNHTGTAYEFIPAIEGNVTVNHYAGATTLSAASLYSGATNLFGGVLTVAHPDALGVSVLTASGGVLNFESFLSNAVILAGDVDFNVAEDLSSIYSGGVISEDQAGRGFTKTGAGELLVLGTHTFTGDLEIEEGVLAVMGGTVLADTVAVVVEESGTFRLDDSETIGSLAGAGAVVLGSNTLTVVGTASTTYSGVMSGLGGLTINGTGTLVLTGDNTYSGDTVLEGGTLSLGSDDALGASTLTTLGSVVDYADGVTIANEIVIDSDTTQFQVLTGSATQSGVISELNGPRPFEKIGDGELILTADNTWTGDTTVEEGRLTLRGGSINTASSLFVEGGSVVAEMLVDDGGQVSLDGGVSLGGVGGGTLTLSGNGSRLDAAAGLAILGAGGGSLTVDSGAQVNAGAVIQADSAAPAAILVSGTDSLLTTEGDLMLGFQDNGVLLVDDNGRVESVSGYLGVLGGAYGQAAVINDGVWSTESLFVGYEGEGHMQAFAGGALEIAAGLGGGSGSLELGSLFGGHGILEIANASASIENTLWVGRGGDGVVSVGEDGVLQTGSTVVAEEADSVSSALLSGGQWTNAGAFILGEFGWGDLFAEAGGSLTTGDVVLGLEEDSFGTAVISDAGTSWLVDGGLTVGDEGEGALQVRDGAVVTGGAGRAAVGEFSFAEIWLTEDGALNLDSLTLGEEGEGYLTLTDGGTLTLDDGTGVLTLGAEAAGYGVLTIGGIGCGCTPGAPDAAGVLNAAEIVFGPGTGELYFNHTDTDYAFSAELTGAGLVTALSGTTRLTGDSADFTGQLLVFGPDARVMVDSVLGGDPLNSLTVVADGGRLGGSGTLDQYVVIDVDGILEGRSGQTLTLGNLMLGPDAIVEASLGAPSGDVLFNVTGDLTLDGELHVVDLGGFGAGLYGLFSYGGGLFDDGLDITSAPGSVNLSDLSLQITGDRVNLINTAGLTVTFWDGGDVALHDNAAVEGGDGTWTAASATWTDGMGLANGAMDPAPGFAVFSGSAGTVTADDVDGALSVTGMQFAVDGYSLVGDAIEFAPAGGDPAIIRVGDGSAAGAVWTATIDSDLTGAAMLRKTDLGTLILTGDASHTGGTEIAHGELRVGDGGTTGSLDGDVVNEGILSFNRSDFYSFSGAVTGTGDLVHAGTGLLQLTGASSHTGATRVEAGTLDLSTGDYRLGGQTALEVQSGGVVEIGTTAQQAGSIAGGGVITGDYLVGTGVHAGQLDIGGNDQNGGFSGRLLVGTVNKTGDGVQTLAGTHDVQTLGIFGGAIRIGFGGWVSEGVDAPNVAMMGGLLDLDGQALEIGTLSNVFGGAVTLGDGGALILTDGSTTFSGDISGDGSVVQQGAGVFTLGGATTFTGLLDIQNGTVRMGTSGSVNDALNLAVAGGATFDLNDTDQELGTLTGAGRVAVGAGSLSLGSGGGDFAFAGDFAGTGDIILTGGALSLGGDSSAFGGTMTIEDGASLTGSGALGGVTTIADGGTLSGVQGQTLGLGTLVLSDGSVVSAALGAAGDTALFDVAGDLTLDGELEVTDVGGFGAGVYRLFDYGGDLTDNGLNIGAVPAGVDLNDLFVQTSVDNQVNLVSTVDVELRFWDGSGPADDGGIQGGGGIWSVTGRDWTGADGAVNGAYDNPAFAVFMGTGGTVTVDGGDIGVTGMQFAVDGYAITGDGVDLTEAETIVRVGDGTAAGASMTATIGSSLTGAGGLVKTDLGTLILTGTNTYEGGTFVQAGTLIGDADSIAGDVVNDAVLVFDQSADADFAGAISGDGEAFKRGAGVLSLLGANAMDWSVETGGLLAQADAFAGDVEVASGANFTLNADENAAWAGALSGDGTFAKTGAGGLALNGDSSNFEGVAEISEGLLVLNGVLGGELRVLDGAMLAGSGSLAALTAGGGAVIAPGNSIGTLNVTGDVTFETGSIYEVEVDPTSDASDRIVAGGTATLNGGVVRHIGLTGDYGPASTYTILTAAGGVTGTFDAIETDFAFLDASLDYEANAVLMLLERNAIPFPAVGETFNQRSTGAAVEATQPGDPLYDAVVGQNADNARLAFDMLSGELHGSIRTAQSEAAQVLAGTLTGRMDAARSIETGAAFWAQATGSRTRLATDGNAASLTHGATGFMMGADAGFGAVRLGVAGGASAHDYDSHARAGSAEGDSLSLAAYGSGRWGALGLKGAVSGTWHEVQTERLAAFPGFAEVLTADYDAETIHAFVEASWRVEMGSAATLEPFVNIARVRTETDAFTETGGDGALAVQERVQAANLATVGLGMSRAYDQGDGRTAVLSGRLGWRHAWDDTAGDGRHAFAGSPTPAGAFTVRGLPVTDDALVAELGLDLDLKDRLSLTIDWSGQLSSNINANALAATLNWRF